MELCEISRKHGNSAATAKFRGSALNSVARGKLWALPMNNHAKFDAASFILAGEIRNCTNTHTHTKTNNKQYIHTLPIGMRG